MIHYVYRLTYLKPFDERKYYVGKHSGCIDDLHNLKYKTSCKKIKNIFNLNDFKIKIIKVFKTPEEALLFESYYHNKLDVQNHKLFFNESNQMSGKLDRTNRVTVINKITNERITISSDEYKNNPDIYDSIVKNYVVCKDENENCFYVSKEEFDNRSDLVGINKNFVFCFDKNGKRVKITSDEYQQNKEKYTSYNNKKVTCYDLVENKKTSVNSEVFYSNRDRYIGIKSFTGETKKLCNICGKKISASNLERHKRSHFTKEIWVTFNDNSNSFKIKEIDYYNDFKKYCYIIPKEKDNTFGYVNYEKFNIRKVGMLNKNFNYNEFLNIKIFNSF